MTIVSQIVGRLHVSSTNLEVLRYVRSRLSEEGRAPSNWPKRKAIYREALECHKRNRELYVMVMSGNFHKETD